MASQIEIVKSGALQNHPLAEKKSAPPRQRRKPPLAERQKSAARQRAYIQRKRSGLIRLPLDLPEVDLEEALIEAGYLPADFDGNKNILSKAAERLFCDTIQKLSE